MNEAELRAMVRESIATHARRAASGPDRAPGVHGPDAASAFHAHVSHARLPLASGGDDGACIIEPAVRCNHCGYCLSFGH
jgi:hypothetical protein